MVFHFRKVLSESQGAECQPDPDVPQYLQLLKRSPLQLDPFVSDRFPLEKINTAISTIRDGATAGRVMLQL